MKSMLRLMRIHHYIKNLLVFSALSCSGLLFVPRKFVSCVWGFLAFCAISSVIYILNDLCDKEKDRLHPVKCKRPIASGAVSVTTLSGIVVTEENGVVTMEKVNGFQTISGKGTLTKEYELTTNFEGLVEKETAPLVTFASDAVIEIKDNNGAAQEMEFFSKLLENEGVFEMALEMGTLYSGEVAKSFESIDMFWIHQGLYVTMEGKV
jgi:hypothetical protein